MPCVRSACSPAELAFTQLQARLWLLRERVQLLQKERAGFSRHIEQDLQQIRQDVVAIYGALRAMPDVALSIELLG